MSRPAAVLWDMDGLLIDSEPLWFTAEKQVMARLGGPWGPAQQEQLIGSQIEVAVAKMIETAQSDVDPGVVAQWLLEDMVELLETGAALMPGADTLLEAVAAAGIPSALVSSSYRVIVDAALHRIAPLDRLFTRSIAGDEVDARKPDPTPYLHAAELLGVPIAECVVLEDSLTGATAGGAAGAQVIVIPSVIDVPLEPGWRRYDSLSDVDMSALALDPT